MIRLIRFTGLALIALGVWLAWSAPQTVRANPEIDAAAGKKTWDALLCKNCHGANAEGNIGPPLAGLARNATTLEAVVKQVRTPFKNMPAFSADQVSDAQLADLVDYFKSLQPNPDWKFAAYVPAAGEDPGKTLFNQRLCAACHGSDASRIIAQSVKGTGRTTITAAEVLKQVRSPRKNMPTFMPTTVTDADVAAMAPFIKTAVDTALAAGSTATTPPTLPKTGDDLPVTSWAALAAGLAGLLCLGASFFFRRTFRT
jgi:mono/diheme cytochrome c family protein